jgi:hypothetical protein
LAVNDQLIGFQELVDQVDIRAAHARLGAPRWWERILGIS